MVVFKMAYQPISREELEQIVNDNNLESFLNCEGDLELDITEHIKEDYTNNLLCYLEEAENLDAEYLKLHI